MVPYGASAAVQSKFEEVQGLQTATSNSDFEGRMSESELVFSISLKKCSDFEQ